MSMGHLQWKNMVIKQHTKTVLHKKGHEMNAKIKGNRNIQKQRVPKFKSLSISGNNKRQDK